MSTAPRPQPTAQDRVNLDPKHYAVELENERVRVLRITYGPHEKSVMHGHPSIVTVNLTDAHLKFTYHDGKTEIIEARAGQVLSFPAFENLPENLSDKPYEAIVIELK